MINGKQILAGTAVLVITLGAMAIQPAQAGWLQDAGRRLDNSVRTELGRGAETLRNSVTKEYKFTIINRTRNTITYQINNKPYLLSAGYKKAHSYRGTQKPKISFDGSYRNGVQTRSYTLNNGTFSFKKQGSSELDLFRQ